MIDARTGTDGLAAGLPATKAGERLRPAEFARRLKATLAVSEGRRKHRKRHTAPDANDDNPVCDVHPPGQCPSVKEGHCPSVKDGLTDLRERG